MNYPYDLIEVVWDDACNEAGWQSVKDVKLHKQIVVTVAFLIKEDKKYILVGHTFTDPDDFLGMFQIPKGMIISRRTIRKSRGKRGQRTA